MKATVLAALGLSVALGATRASAAPGFWQRASRPEAASQQLLLNRAERLLSSIGAPELEAELSAGVIALSQLSEVPWPCRLNARRAVPDAEPRAWLDPRLEYLIGGALVDSRTHREAQARCLLERALTDAPDSPLAAEGLTKLARAAKMQGDRSAERVALSRALQLAWDSDERAELFSSLAESELSLGELGRAVRDYRSALGSSQPDVVSLAYSGLSVALDRSGDLPSALNAAKQALAIQLSPTSYPVASALDLPDIVFNPSYEIHYYKALSAMAVAELGKDELARRDALSEAVEQWSSYLSRAEADASRWAPRAALHQQRCERRLSEISDDLRKIKVAPVAAPSAPLL